MNPDEPSQRAEVTTRRLPAITVPDELQRNDPKVLEAGVEDTGEVLLRAMAQRIGLTDFAGRDLLDIGCGVRFTQTLINRDIPFRSYTGIDVWPPMVTWLKENVESRDERFHFELWNVQNAMYHKAGPAMQSISGLPVKGTYDVIMGFSLFTHLDPDDTGCMLKFMRQVVQENGHLFFTAFCDEGIESFQDKVLDRPLLNASYNPGYLENILRRNGWETLSYRPPQPYMQHSFLCRAAVVSKPA